MYRVSSQERERPAKLTKGQREEEMSWLKSGGGTHIAMSYKFLKENWSTNLFLVS